MTHDEAIRVADETAQREHAAYVVYRFPAWPPDVYGVIAVGRGLPPQAQTFELYPIADTATGQRSLFG